MNKITFNHTTEYYRKNGDKYKTIHEIKKLCYCLYCNYKCFNNERYFHAHLATKRHKENLSNDVIKPNIQLDEVFKIFVGPQINYFDDNNEYGLIQVTNKVFD